jgi:hypothetical protein
MVPVTATIQRRREVFRKERKSFRARYLDVGNNPN